MSLEPPTTFIGWIRWFVVVAAALAILYVALGQFGIPIPGWFVQMLCVCVVAFVALALLNLLAGAKP